MLDPREIENKRFSVTRLAAGYDQDEVDEFLDQCGATVTELNNKVDDLLLRLNKAQKEAPSSNQTQLAGIERLLVVAQQTADQTEAEANHRAGTMLAEATDKSSVIVGKAHARADELVAEATAKAKGIVDTAEQEAARIIAEANAKRDEVQGHHDRLLAVKNDVAAQLRNVLNSVGESA